MPSDANVTIHKLTEQTTAVKRTMRQQLLSFHRTGQLPLFSQTLADALSINLQDQLATIPAARLTISE
jgi:hypothetical protein